MQTVYNFSADVFPDVIKYTENVTSADLLNFARQIATGMVNHINKQFTCTVKFVTVKQCDIQYLNSIVLY